MSTHINGIVQVTREINAVEARYGDATALYAQRGERILTAIRDGVEADLISWAIGMQSDEARRLTEVVLAMTLAEQS